MTQEASTEVAREQIAKLSASLPAEIDLAKDVRRYKGAGKAAMIRVAMIWRQEELARRTLELVQSDDMVAAALMARAVMETTAAILHLEKLVMKGINTGFSKELDDTLAGFMTGSRVWEELDGAISVMKMVDTVDKLIPGYRNKYELLCEFAHPNWAGTYGAYAKHDEKSLTVAFGRKEDRTERTRKIVIVTLSASVELFLFYFERVGKAIPAFTDANGKWVDENTVAAS